MPPAPCERMDVVERWVPNKSFKPPIKKKSSQNSISIKLPKETFTWELNVYCALFLLAVFKLLPLHLRGYFYGFMTLLVLDAARYYHKRGNMPGPPYTLPLVSFVALIINPVRFWEELASIAANAKSGLCCHYLACKLMVYVTDVKLCREVLQGEGTYGFYAHPNANILFGASNMIYMPTQAHKQFRALLTRGLFSREALRMYAKVQERVAKQYLAKFAEKCSATGEPFDVRLAFQTMTAATSQESFLGPYITEDVREPLQRDLLTFTMGFLCFPFPYLNTGLAKAVQAKKRVVKIILECILSARKNVDKPPRCLLDFWAQAIDAEAKARGVAPEEIPYCSDEEMALSALDFLFAAQDATNSALTFALDVLDTRPDVVARVRSEVKDCLAIPGASICTSVKVTDRLHYTEMAANQLLHHKPPVPMVPYIVHKPTTLGGHFLAKGTVVIPSIQESARASDNNRVFEPERTEADADKQFMKVITFGAGQHKCPGRRYAEGLLSVFLAVFLSEYDFERVGPRPENIMYYPTLFPAENVFRIWKRASSD